MLASEATGLVAVLVAAWGKGAMPEPTMHLYVEHLCDLPADEVASAINDLIRTSKFLPTIAEIRGAVAGRALDAPTPEQAWERVQRLIWSCVWRMHTGWEIEPDYGHDVVERAVMAMGGLQVMQESNNDQVTRGQFLRLYKSFLAERVEAIQLGAGGATHLQVEGAPRGGLPAGESRSLEATPIDSCVRSW